MPLLTHWKKNYNFVADHIGQKLDNHNDGGGAEDLPPHDPDYPLSLQ